MIFFSQARFILVILYYLTDLLVHGICGYYILIFRYQLIPFRR